MNWSSIIQKAINYIENHLLEEINFDIIAKNLYVSSYELHKTFSFMTGITINAYIRNRRLSLAATEIIKSNDKIIDIALKYGYETSESFTKAFTRFHGVAPMFVRKNAAKVKLFNPMSLKISIEGGESMNYKIVEIDKQKFVAIVRSFRNEIINEVDNHDVPDFWDECEKKGILNKLSNLSSKLYGLCSPSKEGESTFNYGIGILIDDEFSHEIIEELLENGFSVWTVERSTYVVFDCVGNDPKCISQMWSKFYREFLPQTGYKAKLATDYEVYADSNEIFCELYIPIEK